MKIVKVKDFGKDHWSLLAYIGTRCVDYGCVLDVSHMRAKHPVMSQNSMGQNFWKPEYSTKLFGYWNKDDTKNPERMLKNHDDFDCLEDLERAGFIEDVGTMINPYAKLTKEGAEVEGFLIKHKTDGGYYSTFVLDK